MIGWIRPCNSPTIPVLFETGLLVIGGGLPGIGAAYIAGRCGIPVLVAAMETFLCFEAGSWHRLWLDRTDDPARSAMAMEWFGCRFTESDKEAAIHPGRLKTLLEDRLMGVGARLQYGCLPVSLTRGSDGWLAVMAGKSGRFAVKARTVIDSTETSVTGYLTSPPDRKRIHLASLTPEEDGNVARRTLGFIGCETKQGQIPVPDSLGVHGGYVHLHPGAYDGGHTLVEVPVRLPDEWGRGPESDPYADLLARMVSIGVVGHLKGCPGFGEAQLRTGSLSPMHGLRGADLPGLLSEGMAFAETIKGRMDETDPVFVMDYGNGIPSPPAPPDEVAELLHMERSEFNETRDYPACPTAMGPIQVGSDTGVLVVGGGTSGAMAALASARQGAGTALIDMMPAPGGTGTLGGVHYHWFGRRQGYTKSIDDAVFALMDGLGVRRDPYIWGDRDSWNIELRIGVLLEACSGAGVRTCFGALAFATLCDPESPERVRGVLYATGYGPRAALGRVVVDCTGDGDVAAFAGATHTYGNDRDRLTMWAALAHFHEPGKYLGGNFTTTVDVGNPLDGTRFILAGRRRETHRIPGGTHDQGAYLAPRESRHIRGDYILTLSDQIMRRTFPDTIAICHSNHDPKGVSRAESVRTGVIPPNMDIAIPYGIMLPAGLQGILVAGKAVSATHDALAAIRMQDDVQQQGAAAGTAAALAVRTGKQPRDIDVRVLQGELVKTGVLPKGWNECTEGNSGEKHRGIVETIAELKGDEEFQWLGMGEGYVPDSVPPVLRLMNHPGAGVVGHLLEAHGESRGKRRLLLSRLLLWHRHEAGVADVVSEAQQLLNGAGKGLPARKGSTHWCQLLPDQGVASEFTYLACLLARAGAMEVIPLLGEIVQRLGQGPRDYRSIPMAVWNHVESVAYAGERLACPEMADLIESVLDLPEFSCPPAETGIVIDVLPERLAILTLSLNRALARCGRKKGLLGLVGFLPDDRSLLARSARDELIELTGHVIGFDRSKWLAALSEWPSTYPGIRLTTEFD